MVAVHVRALETARECALLGARQKTISYLTGLSPKFVFRMAYGGSCPAPRGRPEYSDDHYFRANRQVQGGLCLLAATYRQLTGQHMLPAPALVAAFKHVRSILPNLRFSFDQAFVLVSLLEGIWYSPTRRLDLSACQRCGSRFLHAFGSNSAVESPGCPLCRLQRQSSDRSGAGRELHSAPFGGIHKALPVDVEILRAKRFGLAEASGASRRIALIISGDPAAARFHGEVERLAAACAGFGDAEVQQLSVASKSTDHQMQCSLFAADFSRCLGLGLDYFESLYASAARTSQRVRAEASAITFDNCFGIAALLAGAWGVPRPLLRLEPCQRCGFAVLCDLGRHSALACPFCEWLASSPIASASPRPTAKGSPLFHKHCSAPPTADHVLLS